MYCGDDVSSVVLDIGTYQTRAGYSGEDMPRCLLPSTVGICPPSAPSETDPKDDVPMATGPQIVCG